MSITDADIETRQLEQAAASAAAGVCPWCDEALDPHDPRWAGTYTPSYTAEMAASLVGPRHPHQPYHQLCWNEMCSEADAG